MKNSAGFVAGCFGLVACAFVVQEEPTSFATPPAHRIAVDVPAACALQPDGQGQACALASSEDAVVVLVLDDLMTPFDRMTRPDLVPGLFEQEGWERDLKFLYGSAFSDRRHDAELTARQTSTVPARQRPPGAVACIRGDFAGTVESQGGEPLIWRSRQYVCTWLRKQLAVKQDAGVEVVEIVAPGARAPLDYQAEADRLFTTLRLR